MHSSAMPCQTFSNVFNHEPANVFNQDPTNVFHQVSANVFNNDPSRIGHAFKNGPGEPNRHCQQLFRLFVLFVLTQQPLFLSSNKSPPFIQIKCKRTLFESIFGKDVVGKICWNYLPIFVLTFHDVHLNSATKQTLHPPLAIHTAYSKQHTFDQSVKIHSWKKSQHKISGEGCKEFRRKTFKFIKD